MLIEWLESCPETFSAISERTERLHNGLKLFGPDLVSVISVIFHL